jgi:PKD repeat protein
MKTQKRLYFLIILGLVFYQTHAQNHIQQYEYWFNDDYNQRITTTLLPIVNVDLSLQISASSLPDGIHRLNLRFLDDSSKYSGIITALFLKLPGNSTTQSNVLTACEYWFNNDYATLIQIPIAGSTILNLNENISTASLPAGIHSISIRVKDSSGFWSAVKSVLFLKLNNQNSSSQGLSELEYWFDNDYTQAEIIPVSGGMTEHFLLPIDATGLSNGIHTFKFRIKDKTGLWSSVINNFFVKLINSTNSAQGITEMQYWFDDDFNSAIIVPLNGNEIEHIVVPLPAVLLSNGLHKINIRLKDNLGIWSSVSGQFFHKSGSQLSAIPNVVTSCRYWFDNNIQSVKQIAFQNPVNPFEVIEQIDMKRIWKGQYDFHIQFKDTVGQWSSVFSQLIEKLPYPIAEFQALQTMVCAGDTVFFENTSMDGDTYVWNFGDGTTSNDSSVFHVYSTPGLYSVSLSVADTLASLDSMFFLSDYIYVGTIASPILTILGNDTICQGEVVQIQSQSGNLNWLWSNGETVQTITTGLSGQYSVIISDQLMPSCYIYSDTISIAVIDLPLVNLGNDIVQCAGTVLLDAGSPGNSYIWQDNSTSQTYTVTQTGTYSVTVTNNFSCHYSDTIHVTIHSLPAVDIGPDVIQLFPPAYLDAGPGYAAYLWSTGNTSQSIGVSVNGTYSVTVTDNNGCQNADTVIVTFTTGLFAYDNLNTQFTIFPNPAYDYFDFAAISLPLGVYMLSIYDLNGKQIVCEQLVIDLPGKILRISTSHLPAGHYRIVVYSQETVTSRSLIIHR